MAEAAHTHIPARVDKTDWRETFFHLVLEKNLHPEIALENLGRGTAWLNEKRDTDVELDAICNWAEKRDDRLPQRYNAPRNGLELNQQLRTAFWSKGYFENVVNTVCEADPYDKKGGGQQIFLAGLRHVFPALLTQETAAHIHNTKGELEDLRPVETQVVEVEADVVEIKQMLAQKENYRKTTSQHSKRILEARLKEGTPDAEDDDEMDVPSEFGD